MEEKLDYLPPENLYREMHQSNDAALPFSAERGYV
jgi:hypothetical protein